LEVVSREINTATGDGERVSRSGQRLEAARLESVLPESNKGTVGEMEAVQSINVIALMNVVEDRMFERSVHSDSCQAPDSHLALRLKSDRNYVEYTREPERLVAILDTSKRIYS
jgi:hypothetical protein